MNNDPTNLHCAIVSDLLPLYHDGVVSEITSEAVQQHLAHCAACTEEYKTLCLELPAETADTASTKQQFERTMKKARKKRILITALSMLLTCAIVASLFCFLIQVPIVTIPDSECEVIRTYRYEIDGESRFFVLYEHPGYSGISNGTISTTGGEDAGTAEPYTLVVTRKKTVFAQKTDNLYHQIWTMEAEGLDREFDALRFGSAVIWTVEANGDDPVPDYVYAYHEYERQGSSIIEAWITDIENNRIGAQYSDGRYLLWNLDGDLLYDGYPDESGNYPDLPF